MDMDRVYYDMDGNERNILEMVKLYPEWAANRLQAVEFALREACQYRVDICRNSNADDDEDPLLWDKTLRRWINALGV